MGTYFLSLIVLGFASWANPLLPGGSGTTKDLSKNAFSHPFNGITVEQKNQFFVGNSFFKAAWVQAPATTQGRDGLGPTFNARACAACHAFDGRTGAYLDNGVEVKVGLSLLIRLKTFSKNHWGDHPEYGGQINPNGVQGVPGEMQPVVSFLEESGTYPDGSSYKLRKPQFTFVNVSRSELDESTFISPRIPQQIIGLGLIDSINETDITSQADENDNNQDGISGKIPWAYDIARQRVTIGRFGWKSEQPNLRQQNLAAFLGDIGITSSLFPEENCPMVQVECLASLSGGQPEADTTIENRLTLYTQLVSVPAARHADEIEYQKGFELFKSIGCASCHTPSYTTAANAEFDILREQKIYPFSDFLLHDMGEELSEERAQPQKETSSSDYELAREWRTPPLWGIGLLQKVNGHEELMHDGRAHSIEEAILWHGGEAAPSRENFKHLTLDRRQHLIEFIRNL